MAVKVLSFFFLVLFFISRSNSLEGAIQERGDDNSASSVFYFQDRDYPRDCKEVKDQCSSSESNGAHLIQPNGYREPFWVSCSDGWTVFSRQVDGSLTFNRTWEEYQDGFGYMNTEHWLGNEKLSYLTNQKHYEILFEIETETGNSYNISFGNFRISDAVSDYALVSIGEQGGSLNITYEKLFFGDLYRTCNQKQEERSTGEVVPVTPIDCYDLRREGTTQSGSYNVNPTGWTGRRDYTINCDMTTDGGNWTVIQRRVDNGVDNFKRTWNDYKNGFDYNSGREFWIGNDMLAFMTNQKFYELRFDMVNTDGSSYHAKYDFFRVAGEDCNYRLIGLGLFSGTAVYDALVYHLGLSFSTYDRDNDLHPTPTYNCADSAKSGWWYNRCDYCDLNGSRGGWHFYWSYLPGSIYLKSSEMKIRPRNTPDEDTCSAYIL